MTITEYYHNYKTTAGKKAIAYPFAISHGSAKSLSQLYDSCIAEHLRFRDSAIAWHEMLMRYVELPDAVFWVRRYESSSKQQKARHGERWPTRRGCKTEYADGFSYVFVSNFDAHEIFNMVRLGVTPDEYTFRDLMKNHQFPLHYDSGKSCEESDIASYPRIGTTRGGILTVNHWYLAHILGVNDSQDYDCPVDFEQICPRGQLSDWQAHNGVMVRRITDKVLSADEKAWIKAHFLRFVDPLNYYVIPGKDYQDNHNYHFQNNQIGEYAALNDYVSWRFADSSMYGRTVMEAFRKKVFAKPLTGATDAAIDITYSPNRKDAAGEDKKGPKTLKQLEEKYTPDKLIEVAAYYLRNRAGLKTVEKQMSLTENLGFEATNILQELGIKTDGSMKGLLLGANIDDEIAKATDMLKTTLERIKNRGLHLKW